ncbi:MAG: hypothetical protein ACO1QB_18830 [Verrucomicrobiales bacterium]
MKRFTIAALLFVHLFTFGQAIGNFPIINKGEYYRFPDGRIKQLPRLAASVFIQIEEAATDNVPAILKQLLEPGHPLAGFAITKAISQTQFELWGGEMLEVDFQNSPEKLDSILVDLRNTTNVRLANPVYIDRDTQYQINILDAFIIALHPEVNASEYFGQTWALAKPLLVNGNTFICSRRGDSAEDIIAEVNRREQDPEVAWAEPELMLEGESAFAPNDPNYASQWHLSQQFSRFNMGVLGENAWDRTSGTNIIIAILDVGVQLDFQLPTFNWRYLTSFM